MILRPRMAIGLGGRAHNDWQTDGRTVRCYQVHYLTASLSYAVYNYYGAASLREWKAYVSNRLGFISLAKCYTHKFPNAACMKGKNSFYQIFPFHVRFSMWLYRQNQFKREISVISWGKALDMKSPCSFYLNELCVAKTTLWNFDVLIKEALPSTSTTE